MGNLRQISQAGNWLNHRTRGIIVLVTGVALLYTTRFAPVNMRQDWDAWVKLNLWTCFLIPLALIFALGERPARFGLQLGNLRRGALWFITCMLVMLPICLYFSRDPAFRAYYPVYEPARYDHQAFLFYALASTIYMFAWEFMFRGYLLFGGLGALGYLTVFTQAVLFGLAHWGKVPAEFWSSFGAGIALGVISLHTQSILCPFLVHAFVYVGFNALVVYS